LLLLFFFLANEATGLPAATVELFEVAAVELLFVEAGIYTAVLSFALDERFLSFFSFITVLRQPPLSYSKTLKAYISC
jgi:hypothetical protein